MSFLVMDVAQWAEKQFGSCRLGNIARSRRAVILAAQFASNPDASTPDQIERWSDLKAAYHLFDQEDVTFTALAEPHWQQTRALATGTCLLISDTTETDFGGGRRDVKGLKSTLNGVVEAREINPPRGATPVRWVLPTSEPVNTFKKAWQILEYYEVRWLIEEFHKCLKTGCRLESRLYETAVRLQAVAGMLSVPAVRLLQMKTIARRQPDLPAEHVVPNVWLEMLRALRGRPIHTINDFMRHLAGLGGFLMRKGDGEPGWITIWHGFKKLLLCLRGARAVRRKLG
jgi:hypothetical protein